MAIAGGKMQLHEVAGDVVEILTRLFLTSVRSPGREKPLKEIEFVTLVLLRDHQSMFVGQIQRRLGVLPAQMSRIIRALENRPEPLITRRINPADKRKIDVCLTEAGIRAIQDYEAVCFGSVLEQLRALPEEEQEVLGRLVERLQKLHSSTDTNGERPGRSSA